MRNIKNICSISCFLFLLNTGLMNSAAAEEKIITLGGKSGWPELESSAGVTTGTGRFGYDCLQLATNSRTVGSVTDLLIDFEGAVPQDAAGHYELKDNAIVYSPKSKMGSGAGLCRGTKGIRLSGKNGSMFGSSGMSGSFLIEFWLNPSIAENGERVFSWRSSRTVNNSPMYQMISAGFYKNHLEWDFTNVFNGYEDDGGNIKIASYSTVIPNIWTHHAISFDEDTGLLEYRINGRLEALKYVTSNGREVGGSVYMPILGVVADIDICPGYTGLIDDFRIQRSVSSQTAVDMRYDTYSRNGGRFVTKPIMVSQDAQLTKVDVSQSTPNQTSVLLYVRTGDNYFSWTEEEPAWIPVRNHADIKDVKGMYFQLAADLYPDGSGSVTPSVMQVDLHFKEIAAPLPPFKVIAEPGDGEITLSWSHSLDKLTGGYYIFYGERPGEYLGAEALQGESPVDVGDVNRITFTGLKNGKIYYFAVAAYSNLDRRITGVRSVEVYARPLKK